MGRKELVVSMATDDDDDGGREVLYERTNNCVCCLPLESRRVWGGGRKNFAGVTHSITVRSQTGERGTARARMCHTKNGGEKESCFRSHNNTYSNSKTIGKRKETLLGLSSSCCLSLIHI